MDRAYLTPRLGRRNSSGGRILTPRDLGASLKFWLRADMGLVDNTGTTGYWEWTDQVGGVLCRSNSASLNPINGAAAVSLLNAAAAFSITSGLSFDPPWSILFVGRSTGSANLSAKTALTSSDGYGVCSLSAPGNPSALTGQTQTDGSKTTTTAPGTASGVPFVAMLCSDGTSSRISGNSVTHGGFSGAFVLTNGLSSVCYQISVTQWAEIIVANTTTLKNLSRYIKNRYKVTL